MLLVLSVSHGNNSDEETANYFIKNLHVYVGSSYGSLYTDPDNVCEPPTGQIDLSGTYGTEVWCNKEGRNVSVRADLKDLRAPFEVSICSVGIYGTYYERSKPLFSHGSNELYFMTYDEPYTFDVEHIQSRLAIGNTLNIKIRVIDDKNMCVNNDSFCKVVCDQTKCTITITPARDYESTNS